MSQVKVVRIRYETDNKALKDDKKLVESIAKEFGVAEDHVEALNDELKQTGTEVKKVDKSFNRVGDSLKKVGALFGVAFGVAAIKSAVSALHEHALALEAVEKKANTVFGNYAKQVQDFAKVNAASFGLTEQEVIRSAAAVGDLLVPMGFAREEAANMSTDLVGLSGALSEWSGGMVSSTEVANILAKAMLGDREQLKTLGISISEADVQTRLLEKGQKKLTGTALQQAKALATQELIFEKSTDAQAAFANNQDSLTRQTAELNSVLATIKDTIALALIPVFKNGTQVVLELLNAFTGRSEEIEKTSLEIVKSTDKEIEAGNRLLGRYDDLAQKTNLTASEKRELNRITFDLQEAFGESATQIDRETGALIVNRDEIIKQIKARAALRSEAAQDVLAEQVRIESQIQLAGRFGAELEKARDQFAATEGEILTRTDNISIGLINAAAQGFDVYIAEIQRLQSESAGFPAQLAEIDQAIEAIPAGFRNAAAAVSQLESNQRELVKTQEELSALGIDLADLVEETGGDGPRGFGGAAKGANLLEGSIAFLKAVVGQLSDELEKIPKDYVEIDDKGQKVTKTTAEYTAKLEELTTASFNLQRALGEIEPPDIDRVIPQTVFRQADELPRRSSEAIKQYLEDTEESLKTGGGFWENYGELIKNTISASLGSITTFQDASLNRQIAALEANQERQLKATEGNEQAQQAVREKFEKQAGELRKKNAKKKVLIESAIAAVKAFADLGPIGGAIALVALGINTAAQLSLIDSQSFFKGGFTGKDGLGFGDKYGEFAGYVHKDEFVMPKDKTRQWRPLLEMMHEGKIKPWQLKNPQEMRVTVNQFDDGRIHKDLVRLYGAMNRTPNRPKGYA